MQNSTRHVNRTHSRRNARANTTDGLAALKKQAATVQKDVRELAATAGESALGMMGPIEEFVQRKPVKSLLIAAGIGAVFGLLFLRR